MNRSLQPLRLLRTKGVRYIGLPYSPNNPPTPKTSPTTSLPEQSLILTNKHLQTINETLTTQSEQLKNVNITIKVQSTIIAFLGGLIYGHLLVS